MRLVEQRGGFLYQHRPDIMPHGFLTPEELALWAAYYERQDAQQRSEGRRGG
jgi:hypothetical protein